jgi:hypothetical protein
VSAVLRLRKQCVTAILRPAQRINCSHRDKETTWQCMQGQLGGRCTATHMRQGGQEHKIVKAISTTAWGSAACQGRETVSTDGQCSHASSTAYLCSMLPAAQQESRHSICLQQSCWYSPRMKPVLHTVSAYLKCFCSQEPHEEPSTPGCRIGSPYFCNQVQHQRRSLCCTAVCCWFVQALRPWSFKACIHQLHGRLVGLPSPGHTFFAVPHRRQQDGESVRGWLLRRSGFHCW